MRSRKILSVLVAVAGLLGNTNATAALNNEPGTDAKDVESQQPSGKPDSHFSVTIGAENHDFVLQRSDTGRMMALHSSHASHASHGSHSSHRSGS